MISGKESIPRLDFDLFDKDKTSLAKDTINAFHDYGFCVFFNHTIDKDLIANCLDIYQDFFNLPDKYLLPKIHFISVLVEIISNISLASLQSNSKSAS